MKRFLVSLMAVALIVGIAIAAVTKSSRHSTFKFNVEALSAIEEGAHGTGTCWYSTTATENQLILVCISCIYIQGDSKIYYGNTGICD